MCFISGTSISLWCALYIIHKAGEKKNLFIYSIWMTFYTISICVCQIRYEQYGYSFLVTNLLPKQCTMQIIIFYGNHNRWLACIMKSSCLGRWRWQQKRFFFLRISLNIRTLWTRAKKLSVHLTNTSNQHFNNVSKKRIKHIYTFQSENHNRWFDDISLLETIWMDKIRVLLHCYTSIITVPTAHNRFTWWSWFQFKKYSKIVTKN